MTTTKYNEADFSSRLRKMRGSRTQAEFAAELGITSQQTYQNYEKGRIPKADVLQQIAQRCGVSVQWLLFGDAPEIGNPPTLRDESATSYSTPGLDATASYRETLLSLIPRFSSEQLLELAEMLQREKPPGYVLILDQILPMLRERIPKEPTP